MLRANIFTALEETAAPHVSLTTSTSMTSFQLNFYCCLSFVVSWMIIRISKYVYGAFKWRFLCERSLCLYVTRSYQWSVVRTISKQCALCFSWIVDPPLVMLATLTADSSMEHRIIPWCPSCHHQWLLWTHTTEVSLGALPMALLYNVSLYAALI